MKIPRTHNIFLCATLTALLLITFFVLRILFYFSYRELFTNVAVPEIVFSFLIGLRFDFASVMMLCGISFLFVLLPFHFAKFSNYKKIILSLLYLIVLLSLILSLGDIAYYQFVKRRMSYEIFSLAANIPEIATMIFKGFIVQFLLAILCIIIFSVLYWKTVSSFLSKKNNEVQSKIIDVLFFLGICAIIVLGIRGGVQLKPLRESYAFRNDNVALGHLALNPVFTILRTLYKGNVETKFYENQIEAERRVQTLLNDDESFTEKSFPLQRKKQQNSSEKKYNIVIFMMESWGAKNIGALGSVYKATPHFDSLARDGILFTNFFAAGQRTIQGMQAVIGSLPTFSYNDIIGSPLEQNSFRCLGNIVKEFGYQTLFVHGARSGSMGFDAFGNLAGFDNTIAKEDYDVSQIKEDGTWGIFDEYIFLRAHNEFQKMQQPFCSVVFSLTSHTPFALPSDEYKYFSDTIANYKYLNALRYSDAALGKFFATAQHASYFENTIFIIVADHVEGFGEKTMYERFHIPCLIYAPHILLPQIISRAHSQVDILPTLIELLQFPTAHSSFGISALQRKSSFAFVSEGEMFGWIQDSLFLIAEQEKNIGLYNFLLDKTLQHNLLFSQQHNAEQLRMNLLSYLQVGTNALRNNRIYKK